MGGGVESVLTARGLPWRKESRHESGLTKGHQTGAGLRARATSRLASAGRSVEEGCKVQASARGRSEGEEEGLERGAGDVWTHRFLMSGTAAACKEVEESHIVWILELGGESGLEEVVVGRGCLSSGLQGLALHLARNAYGPSTWLPPSHPTSL